MASFWQDVRYGLRMLLKNRMLTSVIVLVLGLGIGVNTTIFSVVERFLLRPLAVRDADRLVVLAISHPSNETPHGLSYLDLLDVQKENHAFSSIAGYAISFAGLSGNGLSPRRIFVSYVTGNYFEMLGITPALGRLIVPSEGVVPGSNPVIVLGYRCWLREFGGNPSVVGRLVRLNGHPFTVIGVTPRDFEGTYAMIDMDGYIPINMIGVESGTNEVLSERNDHRLSVLGLLKQDVSIKQANAELETIAIELGKEYPVTDRDLKTYVFPETLARPSPANALSNPPIAGVFLALVVLVLLVACMDVANMLVVRFSARQKEFAMRLALGASRWRVLRQLSVEGSLLALLGGAVGLILGEVGCLFLNLIPLPFEVPVVLDLSLDWRVFGYTAATTLLSGVAVGLFPALRSSRASLSEWLNQSRTGISTSRRGHRIRNSVVAAQVTASVVLVVTAALFTGSLQHLEKVKLGFQPDHVINLVMDPHQIGFDRTRVNGFYRQLNDRISTLPGVQFAALSSSLPMSDFNAGASVTYQGQTPNQAVLNVGYNAVSTNYFKTMGIQILQGRAFTDADSGSSQPVAIVNKAFAARVWPHENAIGKQFSYRGFGQPYEVVVGLTATGKYGALSETPQPFFYVPLSQDYSSLRILQLRTIVPPEQLAKPAETLIHSIAPDMPVFDVSTMEKSLGGENGFFPFDVGVAATSTLGFVGLILAVLGVYGVVSFTASQREHEIGIRMALGAQRRDILNLVVKEGMKVVLFGICIGIIAMLAFSRVIAGLLYDVQASDPVFYASVALLISIVASIACYFPAARSTRIDPANALKFE